MRVALASIVCPKGDPEQNLARHHEVLTHAHNQACELAVFPEFSLTGSVDARAHPDRAVGLDDPIVGQLVASTGETGVAALFGIAERSGGDLFITQAYAAGGELVGVQRKRQLGEGEDGYAVTDESTAFDAASTTFAVVICAESGFDGPWDAAPSLGAPVVFFCSAPGLYGRRTDEAGWRRGLDWWESAGLAEARAQARRLGLWVGLATQAGSTDDEDFPGLGALVSPSGEVVNRLPDWRPGVLLVDVPVP